MNNARNGKDGDGPQRSWRMAGKGVGERERGEGLGENGREWTQTGGERTGEK